MKIITEGGTVLVYEHTPGKRPMHSFRTSWNHAYHCYDLLYNPAPDVYITICRRTTPGKIDDAWTILCRQICKDKDIDFEMGEVEL